MYILRAFPLLVFLARAILAQ
jgi:hypothetical protein